MAELTQQGINRSEGLSERGRSLSLLVDVSATGSSSRACQMIDEFVRNLAEQPPGAMVDLQTGDLLLTRAVVSRIKQQITQARATLGTVYASLPQTQQAALDEGLFVKEKPVTDWAPLRQPLPGSGGGNIDLPSKSDRASRPSSSRPSAAAPAKDGIDLPSFGHGTTPLSASTTRPQAKGSMPPDLSEQSADFTPVAPQSLEDVPELSAAELEIRDDEGDESDLSAILADDALIEDEPLIDETVESGEGVPLHPAPVAGTAAETLYLRQNLRSGQTVRFNGNVIIVGDVHAGSEVTAGGDIVVWGELRGIAHAGAQGNYRSEIRAMKIEALQLRIADYIARRPDRIYYHKENPEGAFSPESARVADGEIKIFKTMLPRSF